MLGCFLFATVRHRAQRRSVVDLVHHVVKRMCAT
jgi:hypothetical protein